MRCRSRAIAVLGISALLLASVPPLPVFVEQAEAVSIPQCNGLDATIIGNSAANTLTGTAGDDVIYGDGGNDTITGNGGNDTICGGSGDDTIITGSGDDYIDGESGNDVIDAGDGTNTVNGGSNNDSITTGSGNDTIDGESGSDTIGAGEGNNAVSGGTSDDDITTGSGDDTINGEGGSDTIVAGDGNNTVTGGTNDDDITTGSGNDTIHADDGDDIVEAGSGYDVLYGGDSDDDLDGGPDADYCNGEDDGENGGSISNCEAEDDEGIIVVVKDAIPDDEQDFDFSIGGSGEDGFTLDDDGDNENDLSNTKVLVLEEDTGYYVTEGGVEGWNLASISCTNEQGEADSETDLEERNVEIDLEEADIILCTFTNAKAAQVTIRKETEGGDGEFSFVELQEEEIEIETEGGEGQTTVNVFPAVGGTEYTVYENVPEGWSLTEISCEGAEASIGSQSANITLEPGDEVTCTFHNVRMGTLRVTKELINDGDDGEGGTLEFPIEIDGEDSYSIEVESGDGEGSLEISLAPGEYEVTEEDIPEGWMLVENGCEEVEIEAGETTECTITNKKESRIVIHKTAVGDQDIFHYTGLNGEDGLDVEADDQDDGEGEGGGEGSNSFFGESFFDVFVDVEGQNFTITEEFAEDSLWVNTGENSTCEFQLLPGETEHCYFENTKKATIIVMKETTGGDGTFTISSNSEDIGSFDLTTVEGSAERSFSVLIGSETTFSFEETDLPEGWVGSPDSCEVTVDPGETAICSLGNIKKARLIIEKDTIGGNGTFTFETDGFSTNDDEDCDGERGDCDDGDEFSLETEENHAETFFDIFVDIESQKEATVTEQSTDGWQAVGDSSCTVTLEPGEVAICTFTNKKSSRLTVTKTTTGSTGTFHFTGIGGEEGFDLTTITPGEGVSSFFDVFVDVEGGTSFTIEEDPQENWTQDDSCTVTLHPGDEAACIFKNTFVPPRAQISAQGSSNEGENGFTVSWTTDKPATSRVIYDTVSHPDLGAAPNYGYAFSTVEADADPKVTSHNVVIGGLSPGTTYYYRTVSHASPESVGSEQTATTSSSSSSSSASSDPDGTATGAGSGHGSRTAFAKARFLALFHGVGDLPPGAFGAGPEVPLAPEELTFICSMQRSLPPIPTPGLIELIGTYMAELMGRDPAFIVEQLQDPFLCESINTSLRLVPQTVVRAPIPFPVGMDGIPLSRNPSWNACIRGEVTLAVIRNNPDRDEDGRPQDCASYSTEDVWRHPDLGIYFTFRRSPLKIELPTGYVLWKLFRAGI